jgi:hypothetical protein
MANVLYCRRCKADISILEEQEWEEVLPALMRGIDQNQTIPPDAWGVARCGKAVAR